MSPGQILLLVGGLALCLLVAHVNTSWQRRTREASFRLEAERKAAQAPAPWPELTSTEVRHKAQAVLLWMDAQIAVRKEHERILSEKEQER